MAWLAAHGICALDLVALTIVFQGFVHRAVLLAAGLPMVLALWVTRLTRRSSRAVGWAVR